MKAPLTLTWPKGNPPKKYNPGDEITRPITDGQGLTLTFVGCKGVVKSTRSDPRGFVAYIDSVPVSVRRKPLSQTDGAREIIADLCNAIESRLSVPMWSAMCAGRQYLRTKTQKRKTK